MVIAGFTWMTSSGNEEKIKKATATIKAATIGLILTLSAWAIWKFIFERLVLGK
jgi:ABC-type nickel/cobalt efflux system permease component RcnA